MHRKNHRSRSNLPATHRAHTGVASDIAWSATRASGPPVLVVGGWLTHLSLDWIDGACAKFHRRLATRHRLIRFDMPGTGLSPRPTAPLSLEESVSALDAVVACAGEERMTILAYGLGCPTGIVFAARRPDLADHLVLVAAGRTDNPPATRENASVLDGAATLLRADGDLGATVMAGIFAPGASPLQLDWYATHLRQCAQRCDAAELLSALRSHDATDAVSDVACPITLLTPREDPSRLADDLRRRGERGTITRLATGDIAPFFGTASSVIDAVDTVTADAPIHLTDRERAVLSELSAGRTNRAIGAMLGISEHTAAKHISNLCRKLGVNNRYAAVQHAHRLGIPLMPMETVRI